VPAAGPHCPASCAARSRSIVNGRDPLCHTQTYVHPRSQLHARLGIVCWDASRLLHHTLLSHEALEVVTQNNGPAYYPLICVQRGLACGAHCGGHELQTQYKLCTTPLWPRAVLGGVNAWADQTWYDMSRGHRYRTTPLTSHWSYSASRIHLAREHCSANSGRGPLTDRLICLETGHRPPVCRSSASLRHAPPCYGAWIREECQS
jgi:hypothetical protein